jgi:predicted transcriptional regulator
MSKASNVEKLKNTTQAVENKATKMNASQKLDLLEQIAQNQANQIRIMAEELERLNGVITAVAKRVNAIVRSGDEGAQVSSKQINTLLVSDAARELQGKVQFLVDNGVLVRNDEASISEKSFVVGREVDSEGNEVNPRVQFSFTSLEQDGKDKVDGKKVGDSIPGDDSISLEILEIYDIVDKKAE